MKKIILFGLLLLTQFSFGQSDVDWNGSIVFPAGFKVGDYIEFVSVQPANQSSAGNFEISISYTRGNLAAAATHLASISHANPDIWREVGRINNNGYAWYGSEGLCFTVDCNTQGGSPRFRIRAVNVMGDNMSPLSVDIKIRSINKTDSYTVLNNTGIDLTVNKFLPMTNDWSLYVGNPFIPEGANLAIKAIQNGNVGIGTAVPTEKLSVNGKIRAQEIKVESGNWPDYVFENNYQVPSLSDIEKFIKANKHLPEFPSAEEVGKLGLNLGETNALLLKKLEELTLILIDKDKQLQIQGQEIEGVKAQLRHLTERLDKLQ